MVDIKAFTCLTLLSAAVAAEIKTQVLRRERRLQEDWYLDPMTGSPELLEDDEHGHECIFRYRTPPAPQGLNAETGQGYRIHIMQSDCETDGDNTIVFTDTYDGSVSGEEHLAVLLDLNPPYRLPFSTKQQRRP